MMLLTVTLFLCSITAIASVPVESSEDVICESILEGGNLLYSAEEALACCQGEDCEQVENEECRIFSQDQLQPCLINSDEACVEETIKSFYQTPECPEVANLSLIHI